MWTTVNLEARQLIFDAQSAAQSRGSTLVQPEHFLLAIFEGTESNATKVIASMGVDRGTSIRLVRQRLGREKDATDNVAQLSVGSKRLIDLAYDEARLIKSREIGTEHYLLAAIRGAVGGTAELLNQLGLNLETARAVVHGLNQDAEQ